MTPLPATQSFPTAQRLSPAGALYYDELVFRAADTSLPWRVRVSGDPPAFTFTAIPSCADIATGFTTCEAMANAVASCAELLTWGF